MRTESDDGFDLLCDLLLCLVIWGWIIWHWIVPPQEATVTAPPVIARDYLPHAPRVLDI